MKKSIKYIPGFECKFSFDDLYKAAYGISLDIKEKKKLQDLPQKEINRLVQKWAKKAGWQTRRKEADGSVYWAFYP